jgi:hypothetical protein
MAKNTQSKKAYTIETLSPAELAWLAGVLESEAHFFIDNRKRYKSNDIDYIPPPPIAGIRLAMADKKMVERVATFFDKTVRIENRKTVTGKTVYKVEICARKHTEIVLRKLQPLMVGDKGQAIVKQQRDLCDQYNQWIAQGGKTQQAKLAAKIKNKNKKSP